MVLEEDHEEAEANEDHHMHVLEERIVSLHFVFGTLLSRDCVILQRKNCLLNELSAIIGFWCCNELRNGGNWIILVQASLEIVELKIVKHLSAGITSRKRIICLFHALFDGIELAYFCARNGDCVDPHICIFLPQLIARFKDSIFEEVLALRGSRVLRAGKVQDDHNDLADQVEKFKSSVRRSHLRKSYFYL